MVISACGLSWKDDALPQNKQMEEVGVHVLLSRPVLMLESEDTDGRVDFFATIDSLAMLFARVSGHFVHADEGQAQW